jgi:hypothetical protein
MGRFQQRHADATSTAVATVRVPVMPFCSYNASSGDVRGSTVSGGVAPLTSNTNVDLRCGGGCPGGRGCVVGSGWRRGEDRREWDAGRGSVQQAAPGDNGYRHSHLHPSPTTLWRCRGCEARDWLWQNLSRRVGSGREVDRRAVKRRVRALRLNFVVGTGLLRADPITLGAAHLDLSRSRGRGALAGNKQCATSSPAGWRWLVLS